MAQHKKITEEDDGNSVDKSIVDIANIDIED
jgi:hypothetical protein